MRCPHCRDRQGLPARAWHDVRDGDLVQCQACGAWVVLAVDERGWVNSVVQSVPESRGWERDEHR